MVEHFEDNTD
jgi:hypothetical protein